MINDYLIKILQYFLTDPLRILTVLGGSGGLLYWYDRFRNKPRLKIGMLKYGLNSQKGDGIEAYIKFEAENLGTITTSLEQNIKVTGIIPTEMRKKPGRRLNFTAYSYEIKSKPEDRNLPPNIPKSIEARSSFDEMMPFLWFVTYTFKPTRGRTKKIRIRNADGTELSFIEYVCELALYVIINKLRLTPRHG